MDLLDSRGPNISPDDPIFSLNPPLSPLPRPLLPCPFPLLLLMFLNPTSVSAL